MRGRLIALALLGVATHANATTSGTSDAKALEIIRQAKAAAGGAKLDRLRTFYSSGTRVRDGKIDGVFQEWADYRTMAYTNIETFDGLTSSGGYDGKVAWGRESGGKVVILDQPRQLAGVKLSGYLDVQGYFFPDRFPAKFTYGGVRRDNDGIYDVVSVEPDGIVSIDLWFNQRSHLLARLTGQLGSNAIRGDLNSYRTVSGVPMLRTALQTATTPSGVHTES